MRQAEHLRQDIASLLKFMGGPYHAEDKVWYYQVDKSKIKRGAKAGRWIRAKVIRASPRSSTVVIDLGTGILQVNQSLLRRDADIFSDTEIPMIDPAAPTVPPPVPTPIVPPPAPASSSSASAPAPADTSEPVEDGSASYAHVLWQCMMKGKLDFLELWLC